MTSSIYELGCLMGTDLNTFIVSTTSLGCGEIYTYDMI